MDYKRKLFKLNYLERANSFSIEIFDDEFQLAITKFIIDEGECGLAEIIISTSGDNLILKMQNAKLVNLAIRHLKLEVQTARNVRRKLLETHTKMELAFHSPKSAPCEMLAATLQPLCSPAYAYLSRARSLPCARAPGPPQFQSGRLRSAMTRNFRTNPAARPWSSGS